MLGIACRRVASMSLDPEDQQLGMLGHGWQQLATDAVHAHLVETQIRPRLSATEQAMLRSQSGPMSGVPFAWFPTSALSRFDSSQFVSCSSVVSFSFPPPHATAGVAVSLTSLATTVQLVLRPGVGSSGIRVGVGSSQSVPRGRSRSATWTWCLRAAGCSQA